MFSASWGPDKPSTSVNQTAIHHPCRTQHVRVKVKVNKPPKAPKVPKYKSITGYLVMTQDICKIRKCAALKTEIRKCIEKITVKHVPRKRDIYKICCAAPLFVTQPPCLPLNHFLSPTPKCRKPSPPQPNRKQKSPKEVPWPLEKRKYNTFQKHINLFSKISTFQ